MDVVIEREPCYLLEAAELAYSLVNDIPAEKLSGTGLYCIPAEAIQRIRREACAGIESHQTALDFYFRQVTVGAEGEEVSCLGSCMLYTALKSFSSDAAQMCRELTQNWRAMRSRGLRITSISDNSLNVEEQDAGGFSSLAQEMAELPVPQSYRMQLLEAFSAFDTYLDQLLQLLTPIIGRLPALLEPWVRQAARLQEKWSQFFLENSPEEFFPQRSAVVCDNCKTVTMRFRYFFSDMALGRIWSKDGTILFHLGVGKEPEPRRAEPCSMADEEFEALRLMGNPARARMLQAMMYRTMTIQELSKALGLNPGSVHRDLNSLFCAKLLVLEAVRGKTGYRTDYEKIKALTERFLQFLEQNKGILWQKPEE